MKQSEQIDSLATALCAAQAEMGGAVKDSSNPFFKSKYADLGSVVKAIKEPFTKHGLSYVQFPHSDERGIGVVTRLLHTSGQWLESAFTLPMVKLDPQAAGAAITYARRYALQAMAGIPTADDDAESAMFRTEQVDPYTPEQLAHFKMLVANEDGWGILRFSKEVPTETLDALFNSAPKGEKVKLKDKCRALAGAANKQRVACITAIHEALVEGSITAIDEVFGELDEAASELVMAGLTEIEIMQIDNLRAAQ